MEKATVFSSCILDYYLMLQLCFFTFKNITFIYLSKNLILKNYKEPLKYIFKI
jgi:hypothetical protein